MYASYSISHVLLVLVCSSYQTLSNNRSFLPLASISASSEINIRPARYLVDTGDDEWCSNEPLQTGPHILLNFTQAIVLTHMEGRGASMGHSYVTQFSLQYENGEMFQDYEQANGETVRTLI